MGTTVHAAPDGPDEEAGEWLFGRWVPAREPLAPDEIEQRRQAFEDMMDEQGLVQEDDIVAPPWYFETGFPGGMEAPEDWKTPPHRATIFLNFFGGEMTNGGNAAEMESTCITGTVNYPAFNSPESLALAIIQIFESDMAPYGVRIAYEKAPPPELPYQMVMMGGSPQDIGMPPGTLGVSCSSDCGDMWWRDTTFAFTEASGQASTLGTTALQEAAHAFGLAHIDGSQHIMYPFASSGDKIWAEACTPYNDATGGINCQSVHDIFCGGGQQGDVLELTAYFGLDSPDTEPPEVTILEPTDGTQLPSGSKINISAEVTDNHEGAGWKLVVLDQDGMELVSQPAYTFEKNWGLNFPDGEFTVRVQAIDHDRNIGMDEVKVYVGVDAPDTTTSGTGSDSNSGSGGETDSMGGTITDSGTTGEMNGDDGGCACAATPTTGPWALGLLVLGAIRRRRD